MKRPKPPEKPEKPRRPPVRPVTHQAVEQEIQLDADRWTAFRDTFGEREFGIDADGSPIELLRLIRDFTPVEGPIADRVVKLKRVDLLGVARSYRVEHDDDKRRQRSVLISERVPGIRLSEILSRSSARGAVVDIGGALYIMRRLYSAAEKLRLASGLSHFILAPERVVITPRAEVVIVETALAAGFEALAAAGNLPKTLKLALAESSSKKHGIRLDIARIARIGVSLLIGRPIDASEALDALSPILAELNDVAAIRAGDAFSAALRTWLEQALTIEDGVSFDDFAAASAALDQTNPPKDCMASRATFRTYLEGLQIEEFSQADLASMEVERVRAIRTRQTMSRSGQRRGWTNKVAGELGLPHKDEVLQESPAEIAAKPLNPVRSTTTPREISMSTAAAEQPLPPVPPAPAAPVDPGEPLKDSVIKAVASRFGFLLREEEAQMAAGAAAPPPSAPAASVPPPAQDMPAAAAAPADALIIEHTSRTEPPLVLAQAATSEVSPLKALSQMEIPQTAPPSWPAPPAPPPIEAPAPPAEASTTSHSPVETPESLAEAAFDETVEVKRPKKSWFRSVAKQFGLSGEGQPGTEAHAELADAPDADATAAPEAQLLADEEARHWAETDRLAAEAEVQRSAEAARRLAVEQEGRRVAEEEVRRLSAEAEAQRAAEADARRLAAEAEVRRVAAEAEARRAAEEEARRLAAEAEARRKAEEEARRKAEEDARRRAEEEARRVAEAEARRVAAEAEARRKAEEEARRRAEAEARKRAEEDARRLAAEAEARRKAEEEARRLAAEAEARRKAEEEARRLAAEIEARRKAEEEARRLAAEAEARRVAAEAEARRLAGEAEARRVAAEAETRRFVEERARQQVALEAEARRAAEEADRLTAEAEDTASGVEEEVDEEPDEESTRDAWLKSVAAEMGLRPDPNKVPTSSAPAWDHATPPVGMKRPQEWQPPPPPVQYTPSATPANAPAPPVAARPEPVALPPLVQPPQFPYQPPAAALPPPRGEHVSLQQMTPSVRYEDPDAALEPEPSRLEKVGGGSSLLRLAAVLALIVGLGVGGYFFWASTVKPGVVAVESTPAGAEVLVDGESRGTTPITLSVSPGPHKLELRRRGASREISIDVKAGEQLSQQIDLSNVRAVGTLVVNSNPKGAKVTVDGKEYGVTPAKIPDMSVGSHKVVLQSTTGTIVKDVQIQAGATVTIDEGIFSGWIAVFAPFDMEVYERKKKIGSTDQERIMMNAGRHELEFVNRQRGFSESRTIEVGPGATLPVNIEKTEGTLRIEAPEGSEIFIDGARVGEAPIGEQTVVLGVREILAKHPQLGETKLSATVTSSAPADVKVEFTP